MHYLIYNAGSKQGLQQAILSTSDNGTLKVCLSKLVLGLPTTHCLIAYSMQNGEVMFVSNQKLDSGMAWDEATAAL